MIIIKNNKKKKWKLMIKYLLMKIFEILKIKFIIMYFDKYL